MSNKLTLKQGEAKTITFTVKDAAGVAVDLSEATLTFGVKAKKSDSAFAITKEDTDFDKADAESGVVFVDLTEADTDLAEATYIGELKCSWAADTVINKSADFFIQIKAAVIPVPEPAP